MDEGRKEAKVSSSLQFLSLVPPIRDCFDRIFLFPESSFTSPKPEHAERRAHPVQEARSLRPNLKREGTRSELRSCRLLVVRDREVVLFRHLEFLPRFERASGIGPSLFERERTGEGRGWGKERTRQRRPSRMLAFGASRRCCELKKSASEFNPRSDGGCCRRFSFSSKSLGRRAPNTSSSLNLDRDFARSALDSSSLLSLRRALEYQPPKLPSDRSFTPILRPLKAF